MYFNDNIYTKQVAFLQGFNELLKEQNIKQTAKIENALKTLEDYKKVLASPSLTLELDFLQKNKMEINIKISDERFSEFWQEQYPLKLHFIAKSSLIYILDLCDKERFLLETYKTNMFYGYQQHNYIFYILNNDLMLILDLISEVMKTLKNKKI